MAFAAIHGVQTNYETQGTGVPALFIHGGYGGAATTLVPQPATVAGILPPERFQTITYDRRSAGRSEYTLTPYTLADLAGDAAALLDHLGHERAIIIGSSAGGPIALQFALAYPERVIGLGLPNTGANLSSEERAVGRERRRLVERAGAEGDAVVFAERQEQLRRAPASGVTPPGAGAADRARERSEQVQAALTAVGEDDLRRYFSGELRNYGAYLDVDFTPRLGELLMPVCIIHGDADAVVPFAWGEALQRGILGAEFHRIAAGGHGILMWPEAASALRDWALRIASWPSEDSAAHHAGGIQRT